jgi:hypothetical protein
MTTSIVSTAFDTPELLSYLLGECDIHMRKAIRKEGKKNPEFYAYLQYLQMLLKKHDYDVKNVCNIVEANAKELFQILEELDKELEEEYNKKIQPFDDHMYDLDYEYPDLLAELVETVLIEHKSRMGDEPLSMRDLERDIMSRLDKNNSPPINSNRKRVKRRIYFSNID